MSRIHGNQRTRAGRRQAGIGIQVLPMVIIYTGIDGDISEYFCCNCRQLRLSCIAEKDRCMNCGNRDIIVGPVGSLDKPALIRKLDGRTG